jgi:diaminopimelate decarboxylase
MAKMPMSSDFQKRLFPRLPGIIDYFGTPFHIYDEQGIRETGENLKDVFREISGFREFFAVKALPNPSILKIMHSMGFGVDCSSPSELILARRTGFVGGDIMLTSNNTSADFFRLAREGDGCILNLDDISLIDQVPEFPELICFRYNPGERRTGTEIIGNPVESKWGVRHDRIVDAYRMAGERGARRFGLHTMIISNERDYRYMAETVRMLIGVMEMVSEALGIKFEFFNIGGGIGIPYRPDDNAFDMPALAAEARAALAEFERKYDYAPRLFLESGRYMTGPHGVMVASVINRMSKYREYIGINASTLSANARPAFYQDAYHHITILDPLGEPRQGGEALMDVVGPLCENNDKFAKQRLLPETEVGDILVQHDTGAHSFAMAGNYNGWLRPKELLLHSDGSVELIRRAETLDDFYATLSFEPKVLK